LKTHTPRTPHDGRTLPPSAAPGDKLQLQGINAFDAAVHCASLSNKQGAGAKAGASATAAAEGAQRGPKKPTSAFGRLLAAFGCRLGGDDEAA
jgi:hypothetical protein